MANELWEKRILDVITQAHIEQVITARDVVRAVELLKTYRPELAATLATVQRTNNWARALAFLEQAKAGLAPVPKVNVVRVVNHLTISSAGNEAAWAEVDAYFDHLPPVLQRKLIEAGNLVFDKRKLSNELWDVRDNPKELASKVAEIGRIGRDIDYIYSAKLAWDTDRTLPKAWVAGAAQLPNDTAYLEAELQKTRVQIAKLKAKLRNPVELQKTGKARQWRTNLDVQEKLRTDILQKLQSFKKHG